MLQITKNSPPGNNTPANKTATYSCPTCTYRGQQEHHLIKHRRKTQRQKAREQEKQGWKRPEDTCEETFKNQKKELKNIHRIIITRKPKQLTNHQARNTNTR